MSDYKKKPKVPKVKVSKIDLKSFLIESLVPDPYWDDLYNPAQAPKKKKYK